MGGGDATDATDGLAKNDGTTGRRDDGTEEATKACGGRSRDTVDGSARKRRAKRRVPKLDRSAIPEESYLSFASLASGYGKGRSHRSAFFRFPCFIFSPAVRLVRSAIRRGRRKKKKEKRKMQVARNFRRSWTLDSRAINCRSCIERKKET